MAQTVIDPTVIRARIKEIALSEREVAKRMGLAQSKLSLSLNGKRRLSFDETKALADAIEMPFSTVLAAFGVTLAEPDEYAVNVRLALGDNDLITPLEPDLWEEPPTTFVGYDGWGIKIDTDAFSPRYRRGEYIGSVSTDRMAAFAVPGGLSIPKLILPFLKSNASYRRTLVGQEVIATYSLPNDDKSFASTMALKILQEPSEGAFILSSHQPSVPPVIEPILYACFPVDWHLPQVKPARWPRYERTANLEELKELREYGRAHLKTLMKSKGFSSGNND